MFSTSHYSLLSGVWNAHRSYMKEYRMKLASNMLLQEDKSISEIAAAVGYKSQSKFTSAFRDIFQILPTAYQKLYRNQ